MKAEIITIGDEILIGQTIDTNSAWIGSELSKRGLAIHQVTTIRDEREHILQALDDASSRADLILMTGGLGPTQDDITKVTLCEYFDTELALNEEVHERVASFFKRINRPMLEAHKLQAQLPLSAIALVNSRGTASGMWFEKAGKIFVSMPGVPYEMKGIMLEEVFPRVEQYFTLPARAQRTIMTVGVGESTLAQSLEETENELRKAGLGLAYLPSPGQVKLRVSLNGKDQGQVEAKVKNWAQKVEACVSDYAYGYDDETLEEIIGALLSKRGETISVAESCTGGSLSQKLTRISGSSKYFMGSMVSYANYIKVDKLGVSRADLNQHGAVSQAVVEQMATGIKEKFNTTYALSTSGIAGPTGATDTKPVGTVWIGMATPNGVSSQKFLFGHSRERNIRLTTLWAFDLLRREILKKELVTT